MQGMFQLKKRKLMAGFGTCWIIADMSSSPILPEPIRLTGVMIFGFMASGFFVGTLLVWLHQEKMARVTLPLRVASINFKDNWSASVRTDWIGDPDYKCVYRVFYTVSHDELETVQNENTTTFTGDKIRVQEEEIRTAEITCNWIGKNGEESDSNVWKNVFAKQIKMRKKGSISVIHCGYLRQEHI